MRKWILFVVLLAVTSLSTPELALSQTAKLHEETISQGEVDRTPYITYTEFEAAAVGGEKLVGKSSGEKVTSGDLLSISSLDEVIHLFGKPETLTHESPYGQNILAFLSYEGFRLEYIKYNKDDPDSEYELRKLELTSPDWSLTVNGAQLRPGMDASQLSPAVRQTLDRDFSKSEDAFGAIVVAKPGTAKQAKQGGKLEAMRGGGAIQIWVNGGIVDKVRFHREL